ncbi:MAG TPA: hypothetical protein VNN20_05120 [Thermodesulfobacteriota bacterium]|nr:hypothetical protein [Thermodesulfobacteriota bacterium]
MFNIKNKNNPKFNNSFMIIVPGIENLDIPLTGQVYDGHKLIKRIIYFHPIKRPNKQDKWLFLDADHFIQALEEVKKLRNDITTIYIPLDSHWCLLNDKGNPRIVLDPNYDYYFNTIEVLVNTIKGFKELLEDITTVCISKDSDFSLLDKNNETIGLFCKGGFSIRKSGVLKK